MRSAAGRARIVAAAAASATLGGCGADPMVAAALGEIAIDRSRHPYYETAREKLPPLADGAMRIYIYRPQVILGGMSRPIVIVNGRWLGEARDVQSQTPLIPGSVFVVDVLASATDLWHYEPSSREEYKAGKLSLSANESRTWFVRWEPRFGSSRLRAVPEGEAMPEVGRLVLTTYIRF